MGGLFILGPPETCGGGSCLPGTPGPVMSQQIDHRRGVRIQHTCLQSDIKEFVKNAKQCHPSSILVLF